MSRYRNRLLVASLMQSGELPRGYTRLEYIENTSTSYINTGFNPVWKTKVIIEASSLGAGCLCGNASGTIHFYCPYVASSLTRMGLEYGRATSYFDADISARAIYETYIVSGSQTLKVDGVQMASTTSTSDPSRYLAYPLFVFARNSAGTAASNAVGRIYSMQILVNSVLTRDYIPASDPNGDIGLYDKVEGVFYKSVTTPFTGA